MNTVSSIRMVVSPSLSGKPRATLATVYTPNAMNDARCFEVIQGELLRNEISFTNPNVRLAAFLVAFDGVVTRPSLLAALGACQSAYAWNDAVCIEWKEPCGRIDRRHLSAWTCFALAQADCAAFSPEKTLMLLDECLQQRANERSAIREVGSFLGCGQAWLAINLAGPWFSHAIGAVRMAALPRSVLAREVTKSALYIAAVVPEEELCCAADSGMGLALDAYLCGEVADGGDWLVDEIIGSCKANDTRRTLVKRLRSIAAMHGKGRISCLVLAWATDLAESGTERYADISPRTVSQYVRAIARDLLAEFRGKSVEHLKAEAFDEIYQRIILSKPDGSRRNCASALSSWHFFLVYWLDAAPRMKSLHRDLPVPIPKANIIWPHEIETVSKWLTQSEDSRLFRQTAVAFAVASTIRIRTNELLKLRLKNIRLVNGSVEVEICTCMADGGLKSPNARRIQRIGCAEVANLITGWKQRRIQELSMPDDYLFGAPQNAGKPFCHGQMQLLLNRLLKDVTGDASVSIHTLSHTWATERFMKAALTEFSIDVNVFDVLSAEAGHGDSTMTILNYVHRFEEVIRHEIDLAIAHRVHWPEMSNFVQIKHDAYRQRLSRPTRLLPGYEKPKQKIALLGAFLPELDLPAANFGIDTAEAETHVLDISEQWLSLGLIIDVLMNVWCGLPDSVIALRTGRSKEEIALIAMETKKILLELEGGRLSSRITNVDATAEDLRNALLRNLRGRIDFSKIGQQKLLKLREVCEAGGANPTVGGALRSWLQCYRHGYVSLDRPSIVSGLVRLLRQAGVSAASIGIFHTPVCDSKRARLMEEIDAVFIQEYVLMPLKKVCASRGGRPSAYFSISGTDFNDRASNATLCMKGFNALMLSSCVFDRLPVDFESEKRKVRG